MKTVKVLLASYNGEKYIEEQIDTILKQQGVVLDIILSDDKSTDKTLEIVKEKYPQIKVSQNSPGTGSAAKNFLKMVSGLDFNENFEYVSFADQDDIWMPEKIIKAIELAQKNNAELYCSNLTKWDTSNNSFTELKKDFPQKKFDFLFEGGSAGCTYVFTRNFAEDLKNFLKTLDSTNWKGFSHDWLVYFFARSKNYKVVIDNNSYIHYRLHQENVHGHLNKLSWRTIREKSSEVFNGYYQNHIKNYIQYLDKNSEAYLICQQFLKGYISRNKVILKYNTQLMRDKKKFLIFVILNLLKF
ncbi:glycosyltransferase [Chryseobacterium sp. Leaf201]|uniref:glycosyltransferase n=1 Tax=Chryseobacterium sp. Leaf201 TaxID=1735672 RepID=UPI0006F94545|nr:glycosyltransferase [Chryseobacterium sp. Leaf201]KQM36021.1 glycosyl transferase family 2 [Chryseobacterium sp. Leaf201]